jgi:hypothetical protein
LYNQQPAWPNHLSITELIIDPIMSLIKVLGLAVLAIYAQISNGFVGCVAYSTHHEFVLRVNNY